MFAKVGDRILVRGHRTGQPDRQCTILEVRHEQGQPPYVVRWDGSDLQDLYFPGVDATVITRGGN
ncbi:MAG TPA: DUF1918 domain-containing protein [Acidimicrobiales bacterium]|nr:DUF1918 domain-containing protein [Acidimicrobiales bacterium]